MNCALRVKSLVLTDNEIYYRPFGKRLKGKNQLPPDIVMHHKYVEHKGKVIGYYTGFTFANRIGLTTQVPFALEIATNKINTDKSIIEIQGQRAYLYKPRTAVTAQNWKILQFLDLMGRIEIYTDNGKGTIRVLKRYVKGEHIEIGVINKYLQLYPELSINRMNYNFLGNLFAEI